MKPLLGYLSLAVIGITSAGCEANRNDPATTELLSKKVYTRVGMHFETRRGRFVMYSNNYISIPDYVPPGTELTLKKVSAKVIELTDESGSDYQIRYSPQMSKMQMADWRKRHFSSQPPLLPEDLTDQERQAIALGEARPGMSRAAVFLAVGYPSPLINASAQAKSLIYEMRRSVSCSIKFDETDHVDKIGMRR